MSTGQYPNSKSKARRDELAAAVASGTMKASLPGADFKPTPPASDPHLPAWLREGEPEQKERPDYRFVRPVKKPRPEAVQRRMDVHRALAVLAPALWARCVMRVKAQEWARQYKAVRAALRAVRRPDTATAWGAAFRVAHGNNVKALDALIRDGAPMQKAA